MWVTLNDIYNDDDGSDGDDDDEDEIDDGTDMGDENLVADVKISNDFSLTFGERV